MATRIRKKIIYIAPGRLLKIDEQDYRARLQAGLHELEKVTATRFYISTKPRGIRFYTVNSEEMYKLSKRKDGLVPLGLRIRNNVYFLNDKDRFGVPSRKLVEAVTIHEVGHVLGLKHVDDKTSIMHPHLTANKMNASDIALFQRKLGKP